MDKNPSISLIIGGKSRGNDDKWQARARLDFVRGGETKLKQLYFVKNVGLQDQIDSNIF